MVNEDGDSAGSSNCGEVKQKSNNEEGRRWYGRIDAYTPGDCFKSYRELAEVFFTINNI